MTETHTPYLVFEYLYSDAGNFKAFGELWLTGSLSEEQLIIMAGSFESREFFVAEQVGVRPLYDLLYEYSGGRTALDHAWHTFTGIRNESEMPIEQSVWGSAIDFLSIIEAKKGNWKPELSVNF